RRTQRNRVALRRAVHCPLLAVFGHEPPFRAAIRKLRTFGSASNHQIQTFDTYGKYSGPGSRRHFVSGVIGISPRGTGNEGPIEPETRSYSYYRYSGRRPISPRDRRPRACTSLTRRMRSLVAASGSGSAARN